MINRLAVAPRGVEQVRIRAEQRPRGEIGQEGGRPPRGRGEAARRRRAPLPEPEGGLAVAIGQGKSNAEIAGELYMSIATVKAYVTRIFYKLGVDNRVQVAMRVHDAGLV